MRQTIYTAVLSTLLAAAGVAAELPATRADIVSIHDIPRGSKGHGVSVFEGERLERFEVEAIGVMKNTSPRIDYLLVKLSGRGLERSGVIAGMSGSPVYFDGKLAGAVAFAWPFSHDAIGGVTPIDEMRAIPAVAAAAPAVPSAFSGRDPAQLLAQTADAGERLAAALAPLAPTRLEAGGRSGLVWSAAGFGSATRGLLEGHLGALAPMGGGAGGSGAQLETRPLEPGEAVAAVLVDGDFALAATGTVTDVVGDRVLAFGHPFLSMGPTRIPMARAEILTVLSSSYSSFKISNTGPIVGALDADYRAGIAGTIGAEAPMVPLSLRVRAGGQEQAFAVRLAKVPLMTPILAAVTMLGAQEAIAGTFGVAGIDVRARFDLEGFDDLTLRQSFDGVNASTQSAVAVMSWASFVLDNGFAAVGLEGIEVELDIHPTARTETIVGGWASRSRAKPGEEVTILLETAPWRGGGTTRRSITVRIPDEAPAGRISYLVGDGATLDAVRLAFEKPAPQRFEQALRIVSGFHSRRDLLVLSVVPAPGLSIDGEVMPNLPGSIQGLWSAAAPGSATRLGLAVLSEAVLPAFAPLEGAIRVDIEVERREPLTSGDLNGSAGRSAPSDNANKAAGAGGSQ